MIRPPAQGHFENSPNKRRHLENGHRDGLKEFVAYMKNLKELLKTPDAVSDDYLPAICKQISKHLTKSSISKYSCEQICSRYIEVILQALADRLASFASESQGELAPQAQSAVESICKLFAYILHELADGDVVFDVVVNQYGSHTLEEVLKCCAAAIQALGVLPKMESREVMMKSCCDDYYKICQCMFSLLDNKINFWFLAKNPRSTHVLRAVAEQLKISPKAVDYFINFVKGLYAHPDTRDVLHRQLYSDQQGAVTLQSLLCTFLDLADPEDDDCRIRDYAIPNSDQLSELLFTDSEYGRRTLEFLIEKRLVSKRAEKDILTLIFATEDLPKAVSGPLKPLMHKILDANFSFENAHIFALLDCISLNHNVRLIKNLIKATSGNKTHARALVEKLKHIVAENSGKAINWEDRRNAFIAHNLCAVVKSENFWYMLMTAPHHPTDVEIEFKYDGTSLATELVKTYKVGYMTTALVEEINLLFKSESPSEKSAVPPGETSPNLDRFDQCDVFDKLVRCKHGVLFLEALVKGNLPDGIKRRIRQLVAGESQRLCFDAYASWLVATVVEKSDPKERKSLLKKLVLVSSELHKRNPSLYNRLGSEFLRAAGRPDKSSMSRFSRS